MQSVQIVSFVLKELDQKVRKYNKVHKAHFLKSSLAFQRLCLVDQLVKKFPVRNFQEISCQFLSRNFLLVPSS